MYNYLEFSLELEDKGLPGSCLVPKLGFLGLERGNGHHLGTSSLGRGPLT